MIESMDRPALRWPPPGLAELRGRFRALTRWGAAASAIILAASMGFAGYVPDEFWFRDARAAELFLGWGGAGVLSMLGAVAYAWRDVGRATRAVRRGYTWLTIAETMADHRGDTGALISGAGEFSAVTPQVRGAMRVARVVSSFSLLLAAALPIPVLVLLGWIGIEGAKSYTVLLAIVLAPSAALILVSALVTRVERFAFRESRLGHEEPLEGRDAETAVVEPWYAAFDTARNAQSIGRGRRGGAFVGWAINSVACMALAAIVASLVPLWIVSFTAPAVFSWQSMRNYTSGGNRTRTYAALRRFVPPPDAAVTAADAGQAMHALALRGAAPQPDLVRRPLVALAPFPAVPDSVFPNMRARSLAYWWSNSFSAAKKGLTPKQRDFFTTLSTAPGTDLLHTAARASHADIAGARYVTPFNDTISPFAIPADPSVFTYDTLAWAHIARASLLFANGKVDEAESVIGDVIAVGFRLAEDGLSAADESEGGYMLQVATSALRDLYTADPRAAAKKAWLDSTTRPPPAPAAGSPGARAADAMRAAANWSLNPSREKLLAALSDSLQSRTRRFGLVRPAGMLPCTNMRELLFGPSRDLRDALAAARKELVRTPAEGALFDLNTQSAERSFRAKPGPDGFSLDQVLLLRSAHIAGFVLRNHRIVNCAELAIGARQIGQ